MLRKIVLAGILMLVGLASSQSISVSVDGEPVRFSGAGPQKIEGRILVPLRGVMEKLGAYVTYQASTKTVVATRGDVDIQLTLGQRRATVNGKDVMLDVPAMEFRGSTLVPLRFMGEALGADVKWDPVNNAVLISTSGNPSTPPPGGNTDISIDSFDVQIDGPLRAGSTISFELRGTPGGEASVQIPGVVRDIALRESGRGVYTGSYTLPNSTNSTINLSKATAIGRLRIGQSEKLIQAGNSFSVDNQPPLISGTTPDSNARVNQLRPNITAVFDDQNGSGIDINSARIALDARDVTEDATVTGNLIAYRPPQALSPGAHTVDIQVRDKAGNRSAKTWSFQVVDRASVITSFKHDAPSQIQAGDEITFTLLGEPKANVTLQVGNLRTMTMDEVSPGKYVASYVVRRTDQLNGIIATAKFRTAGGETFTSDLTIGTRVESNQPLAAPKITSHQDGDTVGRTATFKGKADPNAKVQVKISFSQKVFGAIPMTGVISEIEVTADARGNWTTEEIDLDTGLGRSNINYTVTAVTVGADNKTSDPTKITLKRG